MNLESDLVSQTAVYHFLLNFQATGVILVETYRDSLFKLMKILITAF